MGRTVQNDGCRGLQPVNAGRLQIAGPILQAKIDEVARVRHAFAGDDVPRLVAICGWNRREARKKERQAA